MENQGGFVHGRYIARNIIVIQDLVKHYGRKTPKPSCLLKIDIQKAYDTINWEFLKEMMQALEFPQEFLELIMECVTTSMFSSMLNGNMTGFSNLQEG